MMLVKFLPSLKHQFCADFVEPVQIFAKFIDVRASVGLK
jgi:hypothetical protein